MFSSIILLGESYRPKTIGTTCFVVIWSVCWALSRERGITRSLPAGLLGSDGSISPFEDCRQTLERCVKWHARAVVKKPFTNFKGTEPLRSCWSLSWSRNSLAQLEAPYRAHETAPLHTEPAATNPKSYIFLILRSGLIFSSYWHQNISHSISSSSVQTKLLYAFHFSGCPFILTLTITL